MLEVRAHRQTGAPPVLSFFDVDVHDVLYSGTDHLEAKPT
jgi:hypothetical protein